MGKRHWVPVVWVVIALAVLSGAGVLLYQHWASVVSVVFSPIGGLTAKVLFGGKVLKVFVVVGFAVLAGAAAVRRTLRRPNDPEPEREALAPPVYGPPATEATVEPPPANDGDRGTPPLPGGERAGAEHVHQQRQDVATRSDAMPLRP